MKLQITGSEEEISVLQASLVKAFPEQSFQFSTPEHAAGKFGSRRPLGEASLVTIIITALASTITSEIVKDIYKYIKADYLGIEVETLHENNDEGKQEKDEEHE